MIEQTIPFPVLARGLARCVREWLLPHLDDAMARTQAEALATILDGLPDAFGAGARAGIARSGETARAWLARHGVESAPPPAPDASIDALVADVAGLHAALATLAGKLRADGDTAALGALQAFLRQTAEAEVALATGAGTDFASLSATEDAAKRR